MLSVAGHLKSGGVGAERSQPWLSFMPSGSGATSVIALSAWKHCSLPTKICVLLAACSPGIVAAADLDDYVKKPDAAFSWKETSTHTTPAGTLHTLALSSQVWQGITWNHELTIYEPAELTYPDSALLFITGGGTGGKAGDDDHRQAFALTKATGARVAVLHQVPNQPLLGDKTEDTLIAETFVRYLETKDKNWPLLFPMVKSGEGDGCDASLGDRARQGRGQAVRRHRSLQAGLDHLVDRRG